MNRLRCWKRDDCFQPSFLFWLVTIRTDLITIEINDKIIIEDEEKSMSSKE